MSKSKPVKMALREDYWGWCVRGFCYASINLAEDWIQSKKGSSEMRNTSFYPTEFVLKNKGLFYPLGFSLRHSIELILKYTTGEIAGKHQRSHKFNSLFSDFKKSLKGLKIEKKEWQNFKKRLKEYYQCKPLGIEIPMKEESLPRYPEGNKTKINKEKIPKISEEKILDLINCIKNLKELFESIEGYIRIEGLIKQNNHPKGAFHVQRLKKIIEKIGKEFKTTNAEGILSKETKK